MNAFNPTLDTAYLTVEFDIRALGGATPQTREMVRHLAFTPHLLRRLIDRTAHLTRADAARVVRDEITMALAAEIPERFETYSLQGVVVRGWVEKVDWGSVAGYVRWVRVGTAAAAAPSGGGPSSGICG
ncbi:hypothetical protein [Microbispora sp. NBRC 16548]|uniref:hypothetical protein n=1 Tax=Microbispora sp. NBRC 16548 TaxID=3030994 RepID=UPI0024A414FD|nr:hypothetical protein [Microbispora sp. NBRC 16548]GLX06712.1 hypothetical protein Misp03_36390 [Microbispora sp. NBRC 16548]